MDALKDFGAFGLAAILALAGLAVSDDYQLICFLAAGLAASLGFVVRNARTGIAATSFLCFGASAYLFSLKLASAEGPSLCNINEVLNCDVINNSPQSEMFGVPIALLGMGFYLGLALAALTKPATTPKLFTLTTAFGIVNVLYSIYLGYVSSQIGAVCVMCITLYVGNALLLGAGLWGAKQEGTNFLEDLPASATSTTTLVLVGTFAIVLLVGMSSVSSAPSGGRIARPDPAQPAGPQSLPPGILTQPRGTVALAGTEPVYGDPNAPYVVLEYADYGCPHCAMAAVEIKQLVNEFPEIQVRFRPFPLTAACNPVLEADRGPERCNAAKATKCAHRQGKFWEMNGLVFANQTSMTDADLAFMANQVGLDMAGWQQCMVDPSVDAEVQADALAGGQAGLMGTPSFYLKGTHGDQWVEVQQGVPNIAKAVSAHMAGAKMPAPGPPPTH